MFVLGPKFGSCERVQRRASASIALSVVIVGRTYSIDILAMLPLSIIPALVEHVRNQTFHPQARPALNWDKSLLRRMSYQQRPWLA